MRATAPAAPGHCTGEPSVLDAAGDLVFRLDLGGQVCYASARTRSTIDLPAAPFTLAALADEADQAVLAKAVADVVHGAPSPLLVAVKLRTGAHSAWYELRLSLLRTDDGVTDVLAIGRDMSAQHATEERLRHLATHDALTGLPNRLLLSDRVRMVVAQARRSGQGFSIVAIGLDGFKKVNEALGLPVGDAVLRLAAARLRKTLRDSDTLARVGGDEFVAILPGTHAPDQVKLVTGRMLATVQTPFEVERHVIYVGASIGVSLYPEHAEDEVTLVALADAALVRAKETGKARCEIYDPVRAGPPVHDISLEAAMFQAVREGEFLLHYQPIVDATTRAIEGFETLMRWKHPTLGMVPPVRFIPIAEANGLINLLGAWALKSACMQIREFERVAGRPLYVSVNISPRQFRSDQFLSVLDEAIAFSGVCGSRLVLEITEGTLMIDPEQAGLVMQQMAERKARIAIDDFGVGYSSLAYLKSFPISVLKVDRAFIKDLPASAKDAAICDAVLDLARHLQLKVVAEGVETEEQYDFLEQRGCQYVQGYLTGRPMPPQVAMDALADSYDALRAGSA